MSDSEEFPLPNEGATVQIDSPEGVIVEGEVLVAQRIEEDGSIYLEIREGETSVIEFSMGRWEGERYSWAKRRSTSSSGIWEIADGGLEMTILS